MEITKQNESFSLTDTTDVYSVNGNISKDVNGTLNVWLNVNTLEGERVGDCNYNKYQENSDVNFGLNCREEVREELAAYANTAIASILADFSTLV